MCSKIRKKPPLICLQFKNVLCLLMQLNQKVFEGHNDFIDLKNFTETIYLVLCDSRWHCITIGMYMYDCTYVYMHTQSKKHIAFQIMRPQKSLGSKSMILFSLKIHLNYKMSLCKILESFSQWKILYRREIKSF